MIDLASSHASWSIGQGAINATRLSGGDAATHGP